MGKISEMGTVMMLSPDFEFTMADVATSLSICLAIIALIVWIVRIARYQTTLEVKQQQHKLQIDKEFKSVHKRIDDKADNSKLCSIDTKLDLILEKIIK